MGSSTQRTVLHVVTATDVETLFSRPANVERMLAWRSRHRADTRMRDMASGSSDELAEPSDNECTKEISSNMLTK